MNLKASDLFQSEIPDGTMIEHSAFFRLDRGEEYCDHRQSFRFPGMNQSVTLLNFLSASDCFFILGAAPGSKTYVHHSSYEINDLDQQFMGHQWLASKSYEVSRLFLNSSFESRILKFLSLFIVVELGR